MGDSITPQERHASQRDKIHLPGGRSGDRSHIGSKRNTGGGRERRDPRRAGADLGGGGEGGEDPGPDEVGEEAGEGEQEGVVHRHEQRRGPVPPLPRRSGAEHLGRLHRAGEDDGRRGRRRQGDTPRRIPPSVP